MSLTGDGSFQPLDDAISTAVAAGVVFALAAGNDGVDVSTVWPAGHPGAITVSAFEDYDGIPGGLSGNAQDDTFASWGNHGAGVDIMAPGLKIRSTRAGGGYTGMSGTSMASPHVAGAAGLYLSQNPGTSPAAVKTALLDSADYAPCANSTDGTCADDPDGIQEPLLMYKSLANGDLTGDGLVDVRDLLLGRQAIIGDVILDDDQLKRGDVAPLVGGVPESDGNFNLGDYLVILSKITGSVSF
jgi:subtilisin family serine protease